MLWISSTFGQIFLFILPPGRYLLESCALSRNRRVLQTQFFTALGCLTDDRFASVATKKCDDSSEESHAGAFCPTAPKYQLEWKGTEITSLGNIVIKWQENHALHRRSGELFSAHFSSFLHFKSRGGVRLRKVTAGSRRAEQPPCEK